MAVTLTLTGKTPGQTQFGLDTFTEHYKCDATADVVLTDGSVPAMGSAHPSYSSMFVTARYCSETSDSASALDLVYMGTLSGVLPSQKHDSGVAIQSASSSFGASGGTLGGVSAQYYAPTNTLSYISTDAVGVDVAADPVDVPVIITVIVGSTNFAPGTTIANIATGYFSTQIVTSLDNAEIVAGQYWQHVSKKTTVLIPFLVSVPSGTAIVSLSAPGANYRIGDVLSITAGGESATMRVTALGLGQSVLTFDTLTNTFTTPQGDLASSGGSGTGARFNVIIV